MKTPDEVQQLERSYRNLMDRYENLKTCVEYSQTRDENFKRYKDYAVTAFVTIGGCIILLGFARCLYHIW